MSTGPDLSFFVLGATGYIGGAVAVAIRKKFPSATFVAYTRSNKNAAALSQAGLKPLVGTGDSPKDLELIQKTASESDVVVNCADADDMTLAKTILSGLEKSTKSMPILIHTSGTGVVSDKPTGSFQDSAKKVWDDNKVEDIKSIDPSQPHRTIDLALFEAAKDGRSIIYIIAPSTIYGVAFDNPGNVLSQQVPSLIRLAIKKRRVVYGGEGTNIWNSVHIADLEDLYTLVLEKAIAERATGVVLSAASPSPSAVDPYSRFYFASVHSHAWGDLMGVLAPIMHARGLVDSDKAVSVDASEVPPATATNSVSASNRGFADGWVPSRPTIEETLEEDLEGVLKVDGVSA